MAKVLDMPKLSPTMEEGQLSVWHKKEGDEVAIDDLLAEVETDKATMEYRSFDRGVLLKILVPAGSTVKLGQPVAILGQRGESAEGLVGTPAAATPAAAPSTAAAAPAPAAAPSTAAAAPAPAAAPSTAAAAPAPAAPAASTTFDPTGAGRVKASPYVRKLARERGLDLTRVSGSGPHGRVVARDVEALEAPAAATTATAAHAVAAAPALSPPGGPLVEPEVKPLSMMRKTIAKRLVESKREVPHFYLTIDVDAEALADLRERVNDELKASTREGDQPEKVSINDLLVRASAVALRRVPECNAQFLGDAIAYHRRVDVSVAVAVADGLVTPVVRDADRKGVVAIAREIRALAAKARAKKLTVEEMTGGTFSISNLGMFGVDEFAAVINPPEGAILACGRVRDEPVVKGGAVVPGKRLALTLSCDHRVIDGAVGAKFLQELRALIERPLTLLLT